jgi:AcrR family transcriptional regulator
LFVTNTSVRVARLFDVHQLQQLPRGSHRLTRDEVLSSQRGRILAAIGEAVAERGYTRTPVAEVIKRAGVSRETFYEQFTDKEDCFLAAIDTGSDAMLATLGAALETAGPGREAQLAAILRAYLEAMAGEPAFARAFLVEAYAAGPRAIERRVATYQRFVDAVAGVLGARRKADRFACEMLVAAISSMVTIRVAAGETASVRSLHRPLMQQVRQGPLGVLMR